MSVARLHPIVEQPAYWSENSAAAAVRNGCQKALLTLAGSSKRPLNYVPPSAIASKERRTRHTI